MNILNSSIFKYFIIASLLFVTVLYIFSDNEDNYITTIKQQREQYEFSLRNSSNSPITDVKTFTGLSFYKPSLDYVVEAQVKKYKEYKTVALATNSGKNRLYRYYAELLFNVKGVSCSLVLLQNTDDETDFFLPFFDQTNGEESYQGGRYLPVEITAGKTMSLDFNMAFNPYCVYNKEYICPIPPKENNLKVPIKAGEKKKEHYYSELIK